MNDTITTTPPVGGEAPSQPQILTAVYRNWKGVTATRNIRPIRLFYGTSTYHGDGQVPQWFIEAFDEEGEIKSFALSGFKF